MVYNVYQDDELIKEGIESKECTVEGLEPNTEYSFSVSEVIGDNESEKSEPVTVTTDFSDVATVAVSPKTNNLKIDGTKKLNVTVSPGTAKQDVEWSSDDDLTVTVDEDGTVTAIKEGEATITVKATGTEKTDTATVKVSKPDVVSIDITPDTVDLEEGGTQKLTVDVKPAKAEQSVTWESDDDLIATVDNGTVTAVKEGTAIITAKSTAGEIEGTATVNVTVPEPVE